MDEITVFEEAPGQWAVRGAGQYQPHDPELPAFVPMSKERAEQVAEFMRTAIVPPAAPQD